MSDPLDLEVIRRATNALALELPDVVHADYAPRVFTLCDEAEKLYDDLRLAEHALGKAVTCLERHTGADADTYGTHVLLRKVWDHIHNKVEALRNLEAPSD